MHETELLNQCPLCGGNIELDSVSNKLICTYCKTRFTYEQLRSHSETDTSSDYAEFKCSSCGAVLVADENNIVSTCAYCGNTSVIKSKLNGSYRPHYIIPFKLSEEDAKNAFVANVGTYTPRSYCNAEVIKDINSIFFPFWLYDCCGNTKIRLKITNAKTNRKTVTNLEISQDFSKIPVDASVRMDDSYMDNIEPFDYSELKPFDKAYFIGHKAEHYDTDVKLMSERSEKRVRKTVSSSARKAVAKQLHQIIPENTELKVTANEFSYKYALFPVYLIRTEYRSKTRLYVVNGQTGKMSGKLPVSVPMVALNVFLGSFIVSLIGAGVLKLLIRPFLNLMEANDLVSFSVPYLMLFAIVFALISIIRLIKIKDEIDVWKKIYGCKTDDVTADNYVMKGSTKVMRK